MKKEIPTMGQSPSWTPEQYDQAMKPYGVSGDQAFSASAQLAWEDSGLGLITRYTTLKAAELEGGEKLTPEEANSRYPGMSVPFRDPVTPLVAQIISDQEEKKRELSQKIQSGPSGFIQSVGNFGASLLPHLIDPIENTVGLLAGAGIGRAVGLAAWGKGASFGVELGKAAAGNLVGIS